MKKQLQLIIIALVLVIAVALCTLFVAFGGFFVLPAKPKNSNTLSIDSQVIDDVLSLDPRQDAQSKLDPRQDAQSKAMNFMGNVLPLDLSKYNVTLEHESSVELPEGWSDYYKQRINLRYLLVPVDRSVSSNDLRVFFEVEGGAIISYHMDSRNAQGEIQPNVTLNPQYDSLFDAVTVFLERYQILTKLDSSDLIATLNGVDITKNYDISTENLKFTIQWGNDKSLFFGWTYIDSGFDISTLVVTFNEYGFVISVRDNRALFVIGDTTINISEAQAIAVALDFLRSYSYKMSDGSIVKDFTVKSENIMASLSVMGYREFYYERKPVWTVNMFFDEPGPGRVYGIMVIIFASDGEIVKHGHLGPMGLYQ